MALSAPSQLIGAPFHHGLLQSYFPCSASEHFSEPLRADCTPPPAPQPRFTNAAVSLTTSSMKGRESLFLGTACMVIPGRVLLRAQTGGSWGWGGRQASGKADRNPGS